MLNTRKVHTFTTFSEIIPTILAKICWNASKSYLLDKLHSYSSESGKPSSFCLPLPLPQNNVDLWVGRTDIKFHSSRCSKSGKNSSRFNNVPGGGVDQERKSVEIFECSNYFGRDCNYYEQRLHQQFQGSAKSCSTDKCLLPYL